MASQDNSRIYDELLDCLNDRMFQIPVKSFMDENCLIFDPSIEVSADRFALHASYQELVKDLLQDFCKSKRVSFGQIHDGIMKLYAEPDLREVFGSSFEQMLSVSDFDLFNSAMISHNIVIQEQVLHMILVSTGIIPDSFLNTRTMAQSDDEKQRQTMGAERKPPRQEKEFEEQRKLLEQEMKLLALVSASSAKVSKPSPPVQANAKSTGKSSSTADKKPSSSDLRGGQSVTSPSSQKSSASSAAAAAAASQMSSAEAAQKWMKDAQEESGNHRDEGYAITDSRRKIDASDMKQRQQFLREQRDKILTMRREAREKQLGSDTEPGTTMGSNDATRNQKSTATSPASASTDQEKMLAKRRALAAKLRQEVVDKQ